ncbi:MAG: hypothetical protein KF832_09295 [Caldilineaceae bacterium]|nr:hypothetical protein [Caldilineaceae bacterium]
MIDLAPGHKLGLLVKNPVLLAGGMIGYGEALYPGLDLKQLGAVVVGPVLHQSSGGSAPPRLAEVPGGMILSAGRQNRGVTDVIKRYAQRWARLGAPVIVQVADTQPSALAAVLEQLAGIDAVAGIEVVAGQDGDAEACKRLVQTAVQVCDVPVWVKLPLAEAPRLAPLAVAAGAVGLVMGQPLAAAMPRQRFGKSDPVLVQGALYGPAAFPLLLPTLLAVSRLALPAALIACGGIHAADQARLVLQIPGVVALQVDSAVWIEPGLPARLVAALA